MKNCVFLFFSMVSVEEKSIQCWLYWIFVVCFPFHFVRVKFLVSFSGFLNDVSTPRRSTSLLDYQSTSTDDVEFLHSAWNLSNFRSSSSSLDRKPPRDLRVKRARGSRKITVILSRFQFIYHFGGCMHRNHHQCVVFNKLFKLHF